MPPPGGAILFDGRPVADLRKAIFADIRTKAVALGPESREHIPEELFLYGVFSEYDFTLPTLRLDRVFSKDVEIDGTRYLELHIPMVGRPRNLEWSVERGGVPERWRGAFEYEMVEGDLCSYVALTGSEPDRIDRVTDEVLAALETRYQQLEGALSRIEADAERAARREYRKQTRESRVSPGQ